MAKSYHAPRIFWDTYGAVGVQIFFVISGYLITSILLREHEKTATIDLPKFYLRRSLRIFPAAFLFMAIAAVFFWRELRWYNILAATFYFANLDSSRPWIFGHLWSLSIEEQFYLLWPSVLKRWYKHRVAILTGVAVFAPVCEAILYQLKVRGGGSGIFPLAGDNLAVGCLLAIFAARIPKIRPSLALGAALGVVLIPLFPASSASRTLLMLFVLRPLFYLSIATVLMHVVQTPYKALNVLPVAWLGRISYSLYLWQQPFCADPALRSSWYWLLALACACLSYYFIEQPVLRWRERRTYHTRESAAVALEGCATAA